jgi:hypothetical protein
MTKEFSMIDQTNWVNSFPKQDLTASSIAYRSGTVVHFQNGDLWMIQYQNLDRIYLQKDPVTQLYQVIKIHSHDNQIWEK